MSITQIPKFPVVKDSLHAELRKRVQQYFDDKGIKATGNISLFTKAIILVTAFVLVYIHLIFFTPHWYIAIPECIILGCLIAAIGFNVMHDGSHGSFSKHKWKNKLAAASLSMLGANHFMWNMKHNMLHHSFTNVDGVDDDIEIGVLMRMAPTQKRYKLHRFQHFYFWFLYMLLYVFWIFFTDYHKYFTQKIGNVPLKKMATKDHIEFWLTKIYHGFIFIALPIIMVGWFYWLMGFLVATLVSGFVLSIVFQLAHTVEHTHFPIADFDNNKLPDEFAAHQIKTTANFATKNKIVSWLVGGLNFQIEHHLFPKISHVHYPAISKIVKSVCAEYQLTYIEYPTVSRAIVAHVRFLKHLGKYD
ncbi:MAG TPA: acyl-CoA desaturase [Chitinophagaceae bacterium]|nr:acyl-CoA desaturase [Chitinophagaceae bacterium]MCC6633994.1 acyl-CoA desaturase [Chitinophagaceae bacterium]HMZ46983.1 acyl-CoA desaturase [Chitinophagaceae bacterium]HNE94034.1 acyl-CoA desaturase [Chitinophagaceae bacterium]HNJ57890.1 acyl-CoA desaturase [Chitinophagaceae bacterium]